MQLTDDSIAQLYTIPASDWTAINKRVGVVLMTAAIASEVESELPGYGTLLTDCQTWSNSTFQSLIDQSNALHTYATTAIANFSALQQSVNALTGDTVPQDVQQQTSAAIVQLANDTAPLTQAFATLSSQVSDFMKANQTVDSQLNQIQGSLGFVWQPITDITTAVDHATGLVNGAFQAIDNDLQSAVSNQIDVTMPFLESLSIENAIQMWQRIQNETAAFPSMANDQKQLWQSQGM
jgi:hypothetical protein